MISPDSKACYCLTVAAFNVRSTEYIGLNSREEFNAAANHTSDLINSSYQLFRAGFYGPCLFLAVTAFEEIAKIKAGHARSWEGTKEEVKRNKDPLFRHSDKHKIALDPVILIGQRLEDTLGRKRVKEIFHKYATGEYSLLRERALYFSRDQSGLRLPSDEVSLRLAAEHLLIAIELFDDYFDFMTAEVSDLCKRLNSFYPDVEAQIQSRKQNASRAAIKLGQENKDDTIEYYI